MTLNHAQASSLADVADATSGAASGASHQSSQMLAGLFEGIDPERRLVVLDVGAASAQSVAFLAAYRCRVFFADLYDEPLVREEQASLSPGELYHEFQDLLGFPAGTRIDLCLLWDFPNYLTPTALDAFCSALTPYLHEGTRGHGFTVHSEATAITNRHYAIETSNRLKVTPRSGPPLATYPHPQAELARLLSCFSIGKRCLLPDGRLEMALAARP